MGRELRGTRYIRENTRSLQQFIASGGLHFLDFEEIIRFYKFALTGWNEEKKIYEPEKKLDPVGRALLGCNDRFFLLSALLRRTDMLHPWLFDRCREVEKNTDGYLDLWARYHYKSTIITFGGIIQELLINPEITIGIFSHTTPIASDFLKQIKRELEDNENLKNLYSDVLWSDPQKMSPLWTEEAIIVKRRSNPKEATVEAHGLVTAQPVGRHFDLMVYDDVVTDKSITSPEIIKKTTLAWENSDNLSKAEGVRKWHAGTRWSFADTYGIIIERKALIPRVYAATDDGTIKGKPVFLTPKRWSEVKKAQKSTISAQMLLNPVAGTDQMFRPEWFQTYDVIPAMMNVYIMCDPSKGRSVDSDRTAIVCIGVDAGGNKFILDGVRHRMRLSQRYEYLKRFNAYWKAFPGVQLVRVGYEQYGMQADIEVIEEYQMRDRNNFEITELNYPRQGAHSKVARVERLEPDMKSGRFYLPAMIYHPDVAGTDGVATWTVWTEADAREAEAKVVGTTKSPVTYGVGQILYRPLQGKTRQQRWCEMSGQQHRIVTPLRRAAEDGEIYDLTRVFIEEARFFPAAPHDDLIDVTSRIYDMEIAPAVAFESVAAESLPEDDMPGDQRMN